MACELFKGIKLDCAPNTGGVEAIWLAAIDDVSSIVVDEISGAAVSTDGTVTAITMAASKNFLKFETLRNGISFEQPSTINLENGSTYFTHTLQFQIPKQDVSKRNKIYQLASGQQKVIAIIKDMNGAFWVSGVTADGGKDNALQVSVANAMTGKAKGDMNGYDVTLTAELPALAYGLAASEITAGKPTDAIDGTTTWA